MSSLPPQSRSLAVKASWISLGLAVGCAGVSFLLQAINQFPPLDHTKQGVLTGFLPRAVLWTMLAGEILAAVVGVGSFLLIRRHDFTSQAVLGIVVRGAIGIAVGLVGGLVLWLVVGHVVIGF